MKAIAQVAALILIGAFGGCSKSQSDTATAVRAATPKHVTKWKHSPKTGIGSQKGIVIETQGDKIATATLYDLKDGDGFAIYSTIGKGQHLPEKGIIIFSNTGNLQLQAQETAQVNDAIRWEVPYRPSATNLAATFWLEGRSMGSIEFQPFKE